MYDLLYDLKNNINFTKYEKSSIIFTIVFTSLIFSFNKWGKVEFSLYDGIINLFITLILVSLTLLFYIYVTKLISLQRGFEARYISTQKTNFIGFFLVFLTNGFLNIITSPGWFDFITIKRRRIGELFTSFSRYEIALISSITTSMLLLCFSILYHIGQKFNSELFIYWSLIFSVFALFSVLPLPISNGFHILMHKRYWWVIVFSYTIVFILLNYIINSISLNILLSILLTIFIFVGLKNDLAKRGKKSSISKHFLGLK